MPGSVQTVPQVALLGRQPHCGCFPAPLRVVLPKPFVAAHSTVNRSTYLLSLLAACATTPSVPVGDLMTSSGALVARLVHPEYDPAHHADTCKPWHQMFAADGRLLTKDLGGLYEHHRGLFLGWNHVQCGGRTFDFWHCRNGESQRVVEVRQQPGPGGEQGIAIDWCDAAGRPVLHERRTVVVRNLADGALGLRLTSELRAAGGDVQLGGDAQHAGCQFRAVQAFAAGAAKVTYVRPTSAQGGEDDVWTHCPWIAAKLPFDRDPVVVLRAEHPDNPPAIWSTRPYGRFGAMCLAKVTKDAPLRLQFGYVVVSDAVRVAAFDAGAGAAATFAALARAMWAN